MKTVVGLSIIALATVVSLWQYGALWAPLPCEEPITYSIGKFDERFSISREYFLEAISDAESVWEEAYGGELFTYDMDEGELPINLIYDRRQEVTEALEDIGETLEAEKEQFYTLEARYQTLVGENDQAKLLYESQTLVYEQRRLEYEEGVRAWNARERNSKSEFESLQAEKLWLQSEAENLGRLASSINKQVDEINSLVDQLDELSQDLDIKVDTYNKIGASRGETFTGGVYVEEGKSLRRIDIYEFSDRAKLVRILAHELGHALGLEHHSDPSGVMYHLNESGARVLSATDKEALNLLCSSE